MKMLSFLLGSVSLMLHRSLAEDAILVGQAYRQCPSLALQQQQGY